VPTLIAYLDDRTVYESEGVWLHPLLELEPVLEAAGYFASDRAQASTPRLSTYDKVVGRAGALLSVRLGVKEIHTELLSRLAVPILDAHNVTVHAEHVEDRIFCATEDILAEISDPNEAHRIIVERLEQRRRDQIPVIQVVGLHVTRAGKRALESITFDIFPGETVLIHGKNGAGKTTLLKSLLGLLPLDSGTVRIGGELVGSAAWKARRHRTAYVRQLEEPTSLPISAREVVEIGARAADRKSIRTRAIDALHRTGVAHLEPRRFGELSGGERQRVAIARALAQQPEVLLLDEPTAGLDPQARESLLELLDGLGQRQSVTVVIVSHDLSRDELPEARVFTIDEGRLQEATEV